MRTLGLFIAGEWRKGARSEPVRSPYDGSTVAEVARAGGIELAAALEAAALAREPLADLPPHRRAEILESSAAELRHRRDELAMVLVEEAGKPLSLARLEAERCVETFSDAASVARKPHAELLDLGGFPSGEGRLGLLRRFPVGIVVGITPFNFPLNLVAHKIAPAVAAGCPVVIKPASQTPTPALLLAEILHRAGLPAGGVNVVPCSGPQITGLIEDERVRLVTFTGSAEVGWELRRRLADRRVALELGGNAAVIVEPDCGNVDAVARRIASGAFSYAGQSCISVQRILVHREIETELTAALVAATTAFPAGDPAREDVLCGPMITEGDADRVEQWVAEALATGARALTPWGRQRSVITPILFSRVPSDAALWAEEAFAPVAALSAYESFEEALALTNDSRFGLQAGLFTHDVTKIQLAFEVLDVGGIIQGDVPSWRTDPMPYGGVKSSGVGREGARFAVEEMTEPRLLVLKR